MSISEFNSLSPAVGPPVTVVQPLGWSFGGSSRSVSTTQMSSLGLARDEVAIVVVAIVFDWSSERFVPAAAAANNNC